MNVKGINLNDEIERYREIVLRRERDDLDDFIDVFNVTQDGSIQIPLVDYPTIEYEWDPGMIVQGDPRPGEDGIPDDGELIPKPEEGEGQGEGGGDGEDDEAGEGSGDHGMLDLEPEEIEEILEEEYDLEFDPGGEETSVTTKEGDLTDTSRKGPYSLLDFKEMYKGGLKKKLGMDYDDEFLKEALRVKGKDVDEIYEWARTRNQHGEKRINASILEIEQLKRDLEEEGVNLDEWEDFEDLKDNVDEKSPAKLAREEGVKRFYPDDEEFRHPEIVEEEDDENSAIVFNYRDVSGSIDDWDRELISHLFAPMDEYLRTKYDNIRFVYVAHDAEAWEVERPGFYQLKSGGGTKVSSALELMESMVEGDFKDYLNEKGEKIHGIGQEETERILKDKHRDVWKEGYGEEWDKYYFGAGDGGNQTNDMDKMTEMIIDMPGKVHLHAEVNDTTKNRMSKFRRDVSDYDHVVAPAPFYTKDQIPDIWRAVFDGN